MPEYVLSEIAVLKLLLHALKYPAATVNGVLVGKLSSGTVNISDALPLLHNRIAVAMPSEIALMQADAVAKERGEEVVGYYQANERADDSQLGAGRCIADSIASRCPQQTACALLVNTSGLAKLLQKHQAAAVLLLFTQDSSGGWVREQLKGDTQSGSLSLSIAFPELSRKLQQHLTEGRHISLVDFEDHLDDISKSWLNANLVE